MTFFLQSAGTPLRRRFLSTSHYLFALRSLALGALFPAASLCPAAAATIFPYTGGGAGTASAPVTGNFSSGFSPGVVGSTASDTLSFAGSSYTATDDLTQQILANMLTFTNTGAVTLARGGTGTNNSISLGGTNPSINVNGAGTALINLDLVLTANTAFAVAKSSGQLTIAGDISGTGGINLTGSGNVITLSGSNSFTGAVTTNKTVLKLGSTNALGNSSGVTITAGGTLDLNGISPSLNTSPALNFASVTIPTPVTSTLTNGSTTVATFGGKVNGSTSFSVSGSGNINLSGPVNLTGFGSSLQMSGTGILTLSGSDDNTATGLIINSGTAILSKTSTVAVHAVGSNGIVFNGGTVQLAGTGNDQIPDNEIVSLDNGTLDMNGCSETIGYVFSSGKNGVITNTSSGPSTLTVGGQNTTAGSNSYGGKISDGVGTVSIIKTGTGTISFSGANTYTGGTTVTGGTLNAQAANSLGTGALAVNNANTGAGTIVTVNFSASQAVSSLSSTVAQPASGTNTAQITIASGATLTDSQSGTTSYAGSVSAGTGGGTLSIAGKSSASPATLNYTGTDTATQTNVGAYANLQLNNPSGAALSSPVAVATSGTLTINPNAANNEIATAAPPSTTPTTAAVTLNGGTLNANGSDGAVNTPTSLATANVTASMGALALGANGTSANPSVLAFSAGTASQPFILAFADSKSTLGSGYLNITGYTGTTNALYIGTTADLSPAQLAQISFNGLKASQLVNGEIVALASAPEPSGLLPLLVGAAALGTLVLARGRKESRRTRVA